MLGYKPSLNKFKRIEIISNIFSDHNGMKLEIDHSLLSMHSIMFKKPNTVIKKILYC